MHPSEIYKTNNYITPLSGPKGFVISSYMCQMYQTIKPFLAPFIE